MFRRSARSIRNRVRCGRRGVKVPGAWDESDGGDPRSRAHDAFPFVLAHDGLQLKLKEAGDVPDEGEDLFYAVVEGGDRCEEIDCGF